MRDWQITVQRQQLEEFNQVLQLARREFIVLRSKVCRKLFKIMQQNGSSRNEPRQDLQQKSIRRAEQYQPQPYGFG
jgi:hypothetical protein